MAWVSPADRDRDRDMHSANHRMTTGSRESDVSPQDPGVRGAVSHEDLSLAGIRKGLDRQSGSNNDPTTAEDNDSLNDQIRLES
jgi:hypothetical protein